MNVFRASALPCLGQSLAQLADEPLHPVSVGLEGGVGRVDVGFEREHQRTQQAVLYAYSGQRRKAGIRYIASPQRWSDIGGDYVIFDICRGRLAGERFALEALAVALVAAATR